MHNKKYIILLLISTWQYLSAQTPSDFIYMPSKTFCMAASYGQTSWNEYWENDLKRDNQNLGKVSTQQFGLMIAGGLTDKLNIIVGLPYISTKTSAGNLLGQSGLQDVSAFLKYKLLKNKGVHIDAVLGGSIPMTNYVPDFLPLSIGMQSKTVTARIIGTYQLNSGFYLSGNVAYILRSTIKIDRESYYANNRINNTNIVIVPNAIAGKLSAGYYKSGIIAELFYDHFGCLSGDFIRRNDAPFPTNNMQSNVIGIFGKYQPKNIGFIGSISQVVSGQNIGKSLSFNIGIVFQKNFIKSLNN